MGTARSNQQRHDKAREQARARRHGRQVDLCARYGKEHRNQKAVGQAVKLGLERMVALRDDIAQDKTGGKRTQHDVEVKDGRERHERNQDKHGQAHEGLRRGVGAFLDKRKEAAADAPGTTWDRGQQHADHSKQAKNYKRLDAGAGRQQHRHGEHGTELAPSAIRENRVANARAGERALAHDGHKRTERRGSKGKRHGDTVEMTDREPRGKAHGKPGDTKRDDPRRQAVAPLHTRDALGVDLKAGKQEQNGQAELGHERDLGIYMDNVEHMGSQHRAEHEQKDRLGNGLSGNRRGDERTRKGHECNDGE